MSEKVDVRELLQKTDIKLYNKRVLDKEQPLNNMLPEKKSVGYNLYTLILMLFILKIHM